MMCAVVQEASMPVPELFQFRVSHFNEKARWALDYKGVRHLRRSLLPGPHKPTMQKVSGQAQVPVLKIGRQTVVGSAAIIDRLELDHPDPPLYPGDASDRRRALEIQERFDAEVGPAIRLAMFHEMLRDPVYFASMFTVGQPVWTRLGYRLLFPVVRTVMRRQMAISPPNAERALARSREAFDFVASETRATGYLVGNRFSVADLTAAALLAPGVELAPSPFAYPRPYPASLRGWWSLWQNHAGTGWVRRIYDQHRGSSHEVKAAA
jgi:glutathione S-transferase